MLVGKKVKNCHQIGSEAQNRDNLYGISVGYRKRQDLPSKLEAWGPWEKVEGEGSGRKERG